jgi:hypothetical protein
MTESALGEGHAHHEDHFVVHVVSENDGSTTEIGANNGTKISAVIEEMYTDFGTERKPDDRLRCRKSGADVFQFADLTLHKYLEQGNCPELKWVFVGKTGGA